MSPGTHDPLGGRVVLKRVGFLPRIHHPATEKTSTYSGRDRGTRVAVAHPPPFHRRYVTVLSCFARSHQCHCHNPERQTSAPPPASSGSCCRAWALSPPPSSPASRPSAAESRSPSVR